MQRFKIMSDESVEGGKKIIIDNGADTYREPIETAKLDIAAAGVTLTYPAMEWPIAGLEVSARVRDWVMENGNHYPMTDQQADDADQFTAAIAACAAVIAAREARLNPPQE